MFVIEKDEMQVITVELKNEVNYLAFFLSWSQSVSVIDIFFKSTANNDNNHSVSYTHLTLPTNVAV